MQVQLVNGVKCDLIGHRVLIKSISELSLVRDWSAARLDARGERKGKIIVLLEKQSDSR